MAFCSSCGTKLPDHAKFCSSCGKTVEPFTVRQPAGTARVAEQSPYRQSHPYAQPPAPYDMEADIATNKVLAILSYLGPLALIPVFMMRDSKYARFHVNQGLLLLIYGIAGAILLSIIRSILDYSPVYFLSTLLWTLFWISIVALILVGITNAASGREKRLPILGRFNVIK